MNLNFALVNRALQNLGQEPVKTELREIKNEDWETAKYYYLSTMLETLAQVEWTGAKRRRELTPAQMPYKGNRDFAYCYLLPGDCAKPVELDGQGYFEAEAELLYTDESPARLLYITNGKRFIDQKIISGGNARRPFAPEYITGGDARRVYRHEWGDNVVSGGNAKRSAVIPPAPEESEDFPEYRDLRLEPNFYLYWEYVLASKYALRLTGQPELANSFFAKAAAVGRAAETVSIAGSAGRIKAAESWQEQLGLN
jgi:hypothetical protein